MRIVFLIYLCTFFIFSSCRQNSGKTTVDLVKNPLSADKNYDVPMPKLSLEEDVFNFGEISQGESVSHEFIIKNTGDDNLVISSAKGTCGCTVPEWPREPILPGKESKIKVTFNSSGKKGLQTKQVTLVTNAIPNIKVLTIKGNIVVL